MSAKTEPSPKKRQHRETKNSDESYKSKKRDTKLSKALSWILRHAAPSLGLKMSTDGYVSVHELLACSHPRISSGHFTVDDVRRVVASNDKQRFHLKNKFTFLPDSENKSEHSEVLMIRANQGHSIPFLSTQELLTPISPSELLLWAEDDSSMIVHGTNREAWSIIQSTGGLSKMKRNHIHFATGLPSSNKVISGMRKSSQIYVFIDAAKCAQDGISFHKSANGVILSAGIDESGILPIRYFQKVVDAQTGEDLLLQNPSVESNEQTGNDPQNQQAKETKPQSKRPADRSKT